MRALVVVLPLDAANQADPGHGDENLDGFQFKTVKKSLNSIKIGIEIRKRLKTHL